MGVISLISSLDSSHYDEIEDLACKNFAPSDIAKSIRVSGRDFLFLWRDKTSPVREAYDRGRLKIASAKEQQIIDKVNNGNITAIQIHDKKAKDQEFEDVKADIFGF